MEKRKGLVAAMMASSILTLEQLMYEKVCGELTEADTEGVIQDILKFAKIYMALLNEDLSVCNIDGSACIRLLRLWRLKQDKKSMC
jgi:hypothetical protein